jgi:hypothetical protein
MNALYGLTTTNCCDKNINSQKVANALLPITFGMFSKDNNYSIQLCNSVEMSNIDNCFPDGIEFDTEKVHIHSNFIHPPPNDVRTTVNGSSRFYESKVVMYKGKSTELILRQDCYGFNCIQNILLNNPQKYYTDCNSLLSDNTIIESPYVWMLMWKKVGDNICFDCLVFTDVSIIRMIKNANTKRAREAMILINKSLQEFATSGKMTYKAEKADTVAHQKVSLFPLRNLKLDEFKFHIKSTDLILEEIKSDTSLWSEIEKSRMINTIHTQAKEIARLKALCNE